jgi:hypothetical protein
VKTTVELPDELLREAKATAARNGQPLRVFVAEALQEKLKHGAQREKPWLRLAGAFSRDPAMRDETRRIQQIIDAEFEQIEPEESS